MTSARQLMNLDCSKCKDVTLHNELYCIRCKTPHKSQIVEIKPEAFMRDFCQRANRAKAKRRADFVLTRERA